MVFLTSLDILDTGFLTVNSRTGQLATTYRVNSGVALRLKSVNFDIITSGNLDKGITPAYLPTTPKNHEKRALVSVDPTMFTLTLFLRSDYTSTSNIWGVNDIAIIGAISQLPHTLGWKAMYYPVDNTAVDTGGNSSRKRNQQLVYVLGATDTSESQGDLATGGSEKLLLWTGTTSTGVGKDLTDVNYIPVRFESCKITQEPNNAIRVTLQGVITG